MSWKRIGRAIKRAAKKVGQYTGVKTMGSIFKAAVGKGKDDGGGDDGYRAEAANSMVRKNVNRQAGAGVINFNTDEEV